MGKVDYEDALRAAKRLEETRKKQEETKSPQVEAIMLDRRRNFMMADRVFFESIIEECDLVPMRYLALGQLAAQSVGRIHLHPPDGKGDGFATGFLVAPNLLLTNQHVLRSREWARAATLTMDSEDDLNGIPKPPRVFLLDPGRLYVADEPLDFCLVAVVPRATDGTPLANFGYLRLFSGTGKIVRGECATIVQHPHGRQKHIAARNNKITVYAYDEDLPPKERPANNFLYYETDTLRGSSGSPVFSDQWFVVALHRRGVPETGILDGRSVILRTNGQPAAEDDPEEVIQYKSNEGVRISRILKRLERIAETAGPQQDSARRALDAIQAAGAGPVNGPLSVGGVPISILEDGQRTGWAPAPEALEITRRNLAVFPNTAGYREDFLQDHPLPLPEPTAALRRELAPRLDQPDEFLLPFRHFTTAMHARRRLPVFAAVNISGGQKPEGGMGARPAWSFDPRIDEAHQPDDTIFSAMLQRGHMAARDYVVWGNDKEERTQADVHSFTLTNVCPQIREFNARREWYELERQIAEGAEGEDRRVTVFVGPILRSTDPGFDDLRAPGSTAKHGTGIRVPLKFWKIVAWVEDGELRHRAFVLDQEEELERAGPLELDIHLPQGVAEVTVSDIEALTDLRFAGLQ